MMARLNPEVLSKVQLLAAQAESFSAPEWDLGPQYNPFSRRVQRCRLNLTGFLSWMPALKSLSMVVGDDYGPQEWLGKNKLEGVVKLTELTVGHRKTTNGVKSWFDTWFQILGADLSVELRANIFVQQASRDGALSFIDVWDCLTDDEIDSLPWAS